MISNNVKKKYFQLSNLKIMNINIKTDYFVYTVKFFIILVLTYLPDYYLLISYPLEV